MSAAAFQGALGRLVADAGYRERVRSGGDPALGGGLTALERRRLLAVATAPGLETTVVVHRAWRLGKLYRMLPLSCTLLGEERLEPEVEAFWRAHPPRSFYFRDEALAFCDHLEARRLRVAYLDDVLAYERATLELKRPILRPGDVRVRAVEFRHDPARLLGALVRGRRPRGVPERPCRLVGTARADGSIEWAARPAGRPRARPGSRRPRRSPPRARTA